MWTKTTLTKKLGITLPIVLGAFGGGASSVELLATVSDSGGLGSFGVNHLSGEKIIDVAHAIRKRTSQPYALNLWVPFEGSDQPRMSDQEFSAHCELLKPFFDALNAPLPTRPTQFWPSYEEQIEAVLTIRPRVFSFVYGIPAHAILQRCRELSIVTMGTATTVDEAMALEHAGIDIIVASGCEAGGHRVSFLKPAEESLVGTFSLIPQVVDAVKIPVIAAGGIADARGVAAALILGAAGVQLGTAFLACDESAANTLHRDALWNSQQNTCLTRAFSGRLARGIENTITKELKNSPLPRYPIHNWFMNQLKAAALAQGKSDVTSLWAGQSFPLLKHHHAHELMQSLKDETDAIFKRSR